MGKQDQEHKVVHDVIQNLEDLLAVDEHNFPGDHYNKDDNYNRAKFVTELGLEFEDLTYTVLKKQKINGKWESMDVELIQGISGVANRGQLTAIMGPSGAGKSTLLDALAGRIAEGSLEGTVWYDGQRMTGSYIKQNSAYVMQQDILFPLLTVAETLLFSAEMRLSSSMPRSEKVDRVQALLMQLGLEHCAHTKIGDEKHRGISGGEKRRVSIGVDIIHGPSLLFLDEPTSGLDASSALIVVEKLLDIAGTGSTVLITIHQPSYRIQQMFSRVLVLARGKAVYQGAPDELGEYLEALGREVPRNMNNVEYLLDLIKEFEQSDAGLDPIVQSQRDGRKASKLTTTKLNSLPPPPLANTFMKTLKSSIVEDEEDGFDHSLTNLRSPLTPGLKLANSFYRPSWNLTPRRSPQPHAAYFTASVTPPSNTESGFQKGIRNPLEVFGERKSTPTPLSRMQGENDDDWEGGRTYQNRWGREVMLLMGRDIKNVIRTPELFLTKLVKAVILSTILATLMHTPKANLDGVYLRLSFFVFMILLIVFSYNDTLPTFIQERYVLIREMGSNAYRASTYIVSSLLVYFPTTFLHALAFVIITWWPLQLHGGPTGFFILVIIFFVTILTANSFAFLVSAVVPNYVTGYTTVISLTAVMFVFSGYLVKRSQLPGYWLWLHFLSPMKYSLEAALQNEFVKDKCFSTAPVPPAPGNLQTLARNTTLPNHPNCYMVGEDVVEAYDLTDFSMWECIGMLVLWCLVYRLLLYVVLRYYSKSERK